MLDVKGMTLVQKQELLNRWIASMTDGSVILAQGSYIKFDGRGNPWAYCAMGVLGKVCELDARDDYNGLVPDVVKRLVPDVVTQIVVGLNDRCSPQIAAEWVRQNVRADFIGTDKLPNVEMADRWVEQSCGLLNKEFADRMAAEILAERDLLAALAVVPDPHPEDGIEEEEAETASECLLT